MFFHFAKFSVFSRKNSEYVGTLKDELQISGISGQVGSIENSFPDINTSKN